MEVLKLDVWYNGNYGVSFYEYGTEIEPLGRFLGHTWKNWSLIPTVRPFAVPPTLKESGSSRNDSGINGTPNSYNDLLGFPLFNNREGTWTFYIANLNDYSEYIEDNNFNNPDLALDRYIRDNTISSPVNMVPPMNDALLFGKVQTFQEKYSQLLHLLHGRELAIILDEDPTYFYRGTVIVEEFVASNDGSLNGISIKYSLFPYKIKLDSTTLIIKDESTDLLDTDIYFSVGKMPVVPYIRIQCNATTSKRYQLGFSNPEINGVIQTIPSSNYYNLVVPSRQSVDDKAYIKLTAIYSSTANNARSTFLCSNFYGDNRCSLKLRERSSNIGSTVYADLFFRKGCL